jgi:hypothetical protein
MVQIARYRTLQDRAEHARPLPAHDPLEISMRITVHLDCFDCDMPNAYAIVWIDLIARRWSREGHAGMTPPQWGNAVFCDGRAYLMSFGSEQAWCVLEGFDPGAHSQLFEGEQGRAWWCRYVNRPPVPGEWRVQWVDLTLAAAEHELFTGEEA